MIKRQFYQSLIGLMVLGLFHFANAAANCAAIDNDIARLQCFDDRERQGANTTTVAPDELSAVPAIVAPVVATDPVPVLLAPTVTTDSVSVPTVVADPVPVTELPTEPELLIPVQPSAQTTVVERIIYVEKEEESLPEEIDSIITSIFTPLYGRREFLLENGQKWKETRDYDLLQFPVGSEVHLKKGLFTGYNMSSGRNSIRVSRVE